MSRKNLKLKDREQEQYLRTTQPSEPKPLSKRARSKLHRRFFIGLFVGLFLHKLVHGHGLRLDNYIRITPRYIIWRLLEENQQMTETMAAAA